MSLTLQKRVQKIVVDTAKVNTKKSSSHCKRGYKSMCLTLQKRVQKNVVDTAKEGKKECH